MEEKENSLDDILTEFSKNTSEPEVKKHSNAQEQVEEISRKVSENTKKKKKQAKERQSGKQGKAYFLLGVILTGGVIVGAKKISEMEMTYIFTEERTVQVDILLEDLDKVSQLAEDRDVVIDANLLTGLTAHEQNAVYQYEVDVQLEREEIALAGYEQLETLHENIDTNIDVVRDERATEEQKAEALQNLDSAIGQVNQIYADKEELMEANVEDFTRATLAAEDEKSATEIEIVEGVKEDFDEDFEKVSETAETLRDMTEQMSEAKEVEISDVQEGENGEYITVTMVQDLVKTRELKGIHAFVRKLVNFFSSRGKSEAEITNESQNTQNER